MAARALLLAALALSSAAWPAPAPASGGWHSLGNHRYRLDLAAAAPGALVAAAIPWRRRDAYVNDSDVVIVSSADGNASAPLVARCYRNASSTSATAAAIVFEAGASATHYLYYLPFSTCEYAGGSCQYSADVTYSPPTHCSDAPWWAPGAPLLQPAAVAYEAASAFDAFTDMERPMAPEELAAFAARATPPGGVGALLIAEAANSSARVWGGGGSGGGAQPFCVYAAAAGGYYLKTGGDPAVRSGWDQGHADKCCSSDASDCVWFSSAAACAAHSPALCRACRAGEEDLGCPAWGAGSGVQLPFKYAALPTPALSRLAATLARNQNFSFQAILLGPADAPLRVAGVAFPAAAAAAGLALACFSTQAVDFWGRESQLQPTVLGSLPLWLGARVARDAPPGALPPLVLNVTLVNDATGARQELPLELTLTISPAPPLPDGSDEPPRAHWLNSRLAADDADVPRPFQPLTVNASALPALFLAHGKALTIGANGLPAAVATRGASASPAVDALRGDTAVLGAGGMALRLLANASGTPLALGAWRSAPLAGNGSVRQWAATASDSLGLVSITVAGSLDFSGYVALEVTLAAGGGAGAGGTRLALELSAPAEPSNLLYGMGLGARGGAFEALFEAGTGVRDWRWDGVNGNNGVWLGSTTGGFMLKARGSDPLWMASVPYDSKAAPAAPPEWSSGGIRVTRDGVATAYTGLLPALAGAPLTLRASLLITPVHNLNLTRHFSLRYAQLGGPANYSFLAQHGASVVNMHQGNAINPWINYPLLTNAEMGAAASACHGLGMRYSVYNTMRELSNRCAETYVLRALGEAYVPGSGQPGADWLREHVGGGFESAWSTPLPTVGSGYVIDAAMRVGALSRWNNMYAEIIQQMMRDFELDGIYLDEIAYDRQTMMRARKLLDARDGVIDHHSDSGAFCTSPAMIYAEHYPFIDKLWYGEGFDYATSDPAYWLVEMSGLVFGLTADMLRYPGMTPYHFRGMLFGESNRWQGGMDPATVATDPFVPVALWRLWQDIGIAAAALHGFWLEEALGTWALPAATNASALGIKATTYALPQTALVVVASFAAAPLSVALSFNNSILGLPGSLQGYCLYAPQLLPFQPVARKLALTDSFEVPPGQGWMFLVQQC